MKCPICNGSDLPEDAKQCPSCYSDLEIFTHISSLEKDMNGRKQKFRLLLAAAIILAAGWGASWLSAGPGSPAGNSAQADTSEVAAMKKELQAQMQKNAELTVQVTTLTAAAPGKGAVISSNPAAVQETASTANGEVYILKKNESLWSVAAVYYGKGTMYTKIAEDNKISDPDKVAEGQKLILNK